MAAVARIETERLLLRELLPADIPIWGPLIVDPDYRRYVPVRRSDETPVERATRSLTAMMARWNQEPLRSMGWVIARRSDGQIIGSGGVEESEAGDGELDYTFGKPFWGQGYGREAAHAMARFALDHVPFARLSAYIVPGNEASIRIAEGLGMRFELEIDYMQFFPDPSVVYLPNPMTRMYTVRREDVTIRDQPYRVVEPAATGTSAG
jgi:RimJ/RimL family protein N-acetyltransferase